MRACCLPTFALIEQAMPWVNADIQLLVMLECKRVVPEPLLTPAPPTIELCRRPFYQRQLLFELRLGQSLVPFLEVYSEWPAPRLKASQSLGIGRLQILDVFPKPVDSGIRRIAATESVQLVKQSGT